jgi:hypothetical protein
MRAVECEHLDVLKWAREHGCPWHAATRDEAAKQGYSDTLPLEQEEQEEEDEEEEEEEEGEEEEVSI